MVALVLMPYDVEILVNQFLSPCNLRREEKHKSQSDEVSQIKNINEIRM